MPAEAQKQLFYEDVEICQEITPLVKGPMTTLHLMRWSAAIENWRREFGPKAIALLAAVAEYETLSSLAAYAYEHPDDPFPQFGDENGAARFEGTSLGHPLVLGIRIDRARNGSLQEHCGDPL